MRIKVKFGIIGCGLMGREFASAAARWLHLNGDIPKPEIVAVCDVSPIAINWFKDNIPTVKHVFSDYKDIISLPDVEALYIAVPHLMHEEVYTAAIRAGKHILGEKPFGMNQSQNQAILQCLSENPEVFVRCTSEFPFYPAYQVLINWIREDRFGKLIEVKSGMHHSSDMDLDKPINWKRISKINGEYGCMGDLGIHVQHVPFRFGWEPVSMYAQLSNIVEKRPDGKGEIVECDTWDNAIMSCKARDKDGNLFPIIFETKRIAPGCTNDVFIQIYGLNMSAKFNTNDPNVLYFTTSWGKEQAWSRIVIGSKPMLPTITGSIFEFGFSDAILQMWGAFMSELDGRQVAFGCFTPEETAKSHAMLTAALKSNKNNAVEQIEY